MLKKAVIIIAPVFIKNYGIHFTTPSLSGVNNNAWYELGIPHAKELTPEVLHLKIQDLFMAAQLAAYVMSVEKRGQDWLVTYKPLPEGARVVLVPSGYTVAWEEGYEPAPVCH